MPRHEILERIQKYVHPFKVTSGKNFRLKDFDPGDTCGLKMDKDAAADLLTRGSEWLAMEQDMLYAQDRWSLLLIFQARDAAGKDGTIKHVMSRVTAGVRGPFLQAALGGRIVARLPVALFQGRAGARTDQDFQPLLLRGGTGRPRPSGAAEGAEAAAGIRHQTRLGRTARRHRPFRGLFAPPGRDRAQVLPEPVEEGAEEALHEASRRSRPQLEILGIGRTREALLGRLHARLRGGDPGTNGSLGWLSPRRSSRRSKTSTSPIRRSTPT